MPSEKEIEVATKAIQESRAKMWDTCNEDRVVNRAGDSFNKRILRNDIAQRFAKDALEAAEKVRWQPIETAPKDGTEVLGMIESYTTKAGHLLGGNVEIIKSVNTEWYGQIWCKRNGDTFAPTHWMPLPNIN